MADDVTIRISARNLSRQAFQQAVRDIGGVEDAGRRATSVTGGFGATVGRMAGALGLAAIGLSAVRSAFNFSVDAAIGLNAQLETTQLQFETLMGDADQAEAHVRSLFDFAARTPFETGPIIEASRQLQVFGGRALNTEAMLERIGNASAATGAPIQDLGMWVGRLYAQLLAGRPFGEAAQRLTELAVLSPQVRQEMEELQDAGGGAREIFALFTGQLDQFEGSMVKQQDTFAGLTSTFWDNTKLFIADRSAPAFELLKDVIRGANAAMEELNAGEAEQVTNQIERMETALASMAVALNSTVDAHGRYNESLAREAIHLQDTLRELKAKEAARQEEIRLAEEAEAAEIAAQVAEEEARAAAKKAAEEQAKVLAKLRDEEDKLLISVQKATTGLHTLRLESEAMAIADVEATDATFTFNASLRDQIVIVDVLRPGVEDLNAEIQAIGRTLAAEAPPTFFDSIGAQLLNTLDDVSAELPGVIVGAFQGGGDVGRSIGSFVGGEFAAGFGEVVADRVGGRVGSLVGGFLGPLGAIGGSLIGGAFDALFSIGGPSEQELRGREAANSFIDGIIAEAEVSGDRIAEAVAEGWDARLAEFALATQDLFTGAGLTAEEAMVRVQDLFDAIQQGPEAVQAVIAEINAVAATGVQIEEDRVNAINSQIAAHEAARDAAIASFTDQRSDFERMKDLAEEYGISLHALGPQFKRAQIEDEALKIVDAFELMDERGANTKKVLRGMSDEVQDVVDRALQFGSTVPDEMRPMLEQMIQMGLLTDENGEKLTSLEGSGIRFAASQRSEFQTVVDSINELIRVLKEELTGGFKAAVDDMVDEGNRAEGIFDDLEDAVPTNLQIPLGFNLDRSALERFEQRTGIDIPGFQGGTRDPAGRLGFARFDHGGQMGVFHGDEAIVPRPAVGELGAEIASAIVSALPAGGGTNVIVINANQVSRLEGMLPRATMRELERQLTGGRFVVRPDSVGDSLM